MPLASVKPRSALRSRVTIGALNYERGFLNRFRVSIIRGRRFAVKNCKNCFYENYPLADVFICNVVSLATYAAGALVLARVGIEWVALYLIYCLALEVRLLGGHCVDCYYYGKTCAFGKGRLAALFFKKGTNAKFSAMRVTWISVAPDFLVALIPLVAGVLLLLKSFDWTLAALLALIVVLSFAGNAFVRGSIACKHCKQRALGCPAEKLFNKKSKK